MLMSLFAAYRGELHYMRGPGRRREGDDGQLAG
jgi:hypothetical protein